MSAVNYKNHRLSRNSEAYSLYEKSEFVKLDALLRDVDQRYRKLQGCELPDHLVNYQVGKDSSLETL